MADGSNSTTVPVNSIGSASLIDYIILCTLVHLMDQDESKKLAASSYPIDFKLKGKNAQANFVNSQHEGQEGQMAISGDQYKEFLLWKQTRDTTSPSGTNASTNMTGKYFTESHTGWIVDSGASNQITGNKQLLLHDGIVGSAGNVQLPTGSFAQISHTGNYPLSGGDLLRDVLCVPFFRFNLMSVSKVTKDLNYSVTFYPKHCVFQDLCTGKVKVIGREKDGLYILNAHNSGDFINKGKSMTVTRPSHPNLWHRRLVHVPMSVLRRIHIFEAPPLCAFQAWEADKTGNYFDRTVIKGGST
ncbi:hypothetical protein H5410_017797 [Solanum commersonii]|uniref:Retrovirus-related Pol polyprotein from transposon TNT 1-94-like beta-barrel domain-containing protein n=1 Tax=Solanum commersonii TaxID=4109 RepID=A0A9J6A069_SOLCO|nr:hypothetical protein H5410_017797 [Solanum commersonii]